MAQSYDLSFYQGDSFSLVFRIKNKGTGTPVNLTGCVPKSDIKLDVTDTVAVQAFTAALVNASDGTVSLSLTPTQTAALAAGTDLVYDVQLHWTDGTIKTYLKGVITVEAEVTRGS